MANKEELRQLWLRLRRLDAELRARDAYYASTAYGTEMQALIAHTGCAFAARLHANETISFDDGDRASGYTQAYVDDMGALYDALVEVHNRWIAKGDRKYAQTHGAAIARGLTSLGEFCDLVQMTIVAPD